MAAQTNTTVAPKRTPASLAHAEELAEAGHLKDAIAELQKQLPSLSDSANKASAHEMLGDLLCQRSMFDLTNAAVQYNRALSLTPGIGRLHFKKGSAMFPLESSRPEAIAALKRSLELGYTNAETFYLLGSVSKLEGDTATDSRRAQDAYLDATKEFQQALRIDTNHIASLGNMGDIAFNLELYAQAARFYQHVIRLAPDDPVRMVTLTRLAHTQTRLGNYGQASALLDQAELARAKVSATEDPLANAGLQIESLRILMYKFENSMAANNPSEAIASCEAIRAKVAEASKEFIRQGIVPTQLEQWDQAAKDALEKLRK